MSGGGSQTTLADLLARDGTLTDITKGTSMLPLLRQNRDFVVITRKTKRLVRHDVAFYRRDNHAYVLHRVVQVRARGYVIRGDNCITSEFVAEENVLGVLTAFARDGRMIPVTDKAYLCFVRIWSALWPLRWLVMCGRRKAGKVKRAIWKTGG